MLILASNSPRRKELLSMLGYEFIVKASDCDENTDINEKWIKLRVYIEWVSKEEIYVATNILRAIKIVLNINE